MEEIVLSPADFVAVLNQTLEMAYPGVVIEGELANFRVSKNRWIYFDLKDEFASVKFFGTVYQLPGPLEDGLMLQVRAAPKLHPQYGFSLTVQFIRPVGEGSLKKAAALLEAKLAAEGLFDPARKRPLPYPPARIGLVTSGQSAAYADFIKILNARWGGVEIELADVQVQGEAAIGQITRAIEYFNSRANAPDVLVVTRGGGSAEDLAAFSTEQVTRAIAASRIPTLVAVGHEIDISLAELAADQRASTPSNAAELLVPDRQRVLQELRSLRQQLGQSLERTVAERQANIAELAADLNHSADKILSDATFKLDLKRRLLAALDPAAALSRGYAIVRLNGKLVRSRTDIKVNQLLDIQLADGHVKTKVEEV